MVSIRTMENSYGIKIGFFEVPLPNKPPVYMSVTETRYNNDERGIVIVDSEQLLRLWRNEPYSIHRHEAYGNPQVWSRDRKYPDAEKGFSSGSNSPVPVANVSYGMETKTVIGYKFLWFGRNEHREQFSYVSFTNGVTRTIWLLSQGCRAFPIECAMPGARELHRLASVPETDFFTVEELLGVGSRS